MKTRQLTNVKVSIQATTETALQRAIFNNGFTKIGSGRSKIEWLDIELPVNDNNRNRVDLIGRMGKRYVICELKYGKGGADNPDYATNELLGYFEEVKKNSESLDKRPQHPDGKGFKWADVAKDDTILIVAANAAYWAYWLAYYQAVTGRTFELDSRIQYCSIDVSTDEFKKQKGNDKKYVPQIDIDQWDIIGQRNCR